MGKGQERGLWGKKKSNPKLPIWGVQKVESKQVLKRSRKERGSIKRRTTKHGEKERIRLLKTPINRTRDAREKGQGGFGRCS